MAKRSSVAPASSTDLGERPAVTAGASRGLEALRDFWQTTAPYDPVRALDSWHTRYEQGTALREQTPRESHVTNQFERLNALLHRMRVLVDAIEPIQALQEVVFEMP